MVKPGDRFYIKAFSTKNNLNSYPIIYHFDWSNQLTFTRLSNEKDCL